MTVRGAMGAVSTALMAIIIAVRPTASGGRVAALVSGLFGPTGAALTVTTAAPLTILAAAAAVQTTSDGALVLPITWRLVTSAAGPKVWACP